MIHEEAARKLRILVEEHGYLDHADALDFILDELKKARKENGRLIAERDHARAKVAEMIQTLSTLPQFSQVVNKRLSRQPGGFMAARGAIPRKEGDELPEQAIRRMRDGAPNLTCVLCKKPINIATDHFTHDQMGYYHRICPLPIPPSLDSEDKPEFQ
jgi:hypothetical protein